MKEKMRDKTVTVVDVGSNSIRTCVYRGSKRRGSVKKEIDVGKTIGLAGYVDESGFMSKDGIDAGCRALSKMMSLAKLAASDVTVVLATGAVRNCANTREVIDALQKSAVARVRILSEGEEAALSAIGASWSTGVTNGLFFDLGGGSTELADVCKGEITGTASVKLGTLSSRITVLDTVFPGKDELKSIEMRFEENLEATNVCMAGQDTIVGVGGTLRLALKVVQNLEGKEPGRILRMSDFDEILDRGVNNPGELYGIVLRLKPDRVHTFLSGCAISRAILHVARCNEMLVSKTGIREGYVLEELRLSPLLREEHLR